MKKKIHKKYIALLTMFATLICTMFYSVSANADTGFSPPDDEEIVQTYTCTFNGVERILDVYSNTQVYFKILENAPFFLTTNQSGIGFDEYGTVWRLRSDNKLYWWNYDLTGDDCVFTLTSRLTSTGSTTDVVDADLLMFDDSGKFVTGYRTLSGETYPILTLEQLKEELRISGEPTPTATPNFNETPAATVIPTPIATPTSAPTNTPSVSDKPVSVANVKVEIKSVKNKKSKKAVISWKKVTGAQGYQIAYSTNKKFKSKKTKNVTKTTVTLSKLKRKKTHYIKVRAYTKANGKKVYGKWSVVKKVKIKK